MDPKRFQAQNELLRPTITPHWQKESNAGNLFTDVRLARQVECTPDVSRLRKNPTTTPQHDIRCREFTDVSLARRELHISIESVFLSLGSFWAKFAKENCLYRIGLRVDSETRRGSQGRNEREYVDIDDNVTTNVKERFYRYLLHICTKMV